VPREGIRGGAGEEDLKRKIKFAKKYFSLTDTIKNLFSFSRSKKT
jgi:hypothetical protein